MIFVSVGTQEFQFDRLLNEIIKLKKENKISDRLIIQSGSNKYLNKSINNDQVEIIDYMNENEFLKILEKSRIFITHGGTGSIIAASKLSKKTIVVPRLAKFNEHVDDHQLEITTAFYEKGIIEVCQNVSFLDKIIEKTEKSSYSMYVNSNSKLLDDVKRFIQE